MPRESPRWRFERIAARAEMLEARRLAKLEAPRVSLPVLPAECPPSQPCVMIRCRANVLAFVNDAGSIVIEDGPTIPRVRNGKRKLTEHDVENATDEAADVVARRARALGVTCMWLYAKRPRTQLEVGRIMAMAHQRVNQIERGAMRTLESALMSDDEEIKDATRPPAWRWKEAA